MERMTTNKMGGPSNRRLEKNVDGELEANDCRQSRMGQNNRTVQKNIKQ